MITHLDIWVLHHSADDNYTDVWISSKVSAEAVKTYTKALLLPFFISNGD